jgi:hypothetical protein
VFISYAHASPAHVEQVGELWQFLRGQGIDARLDMAAAQQPQDWSLWTMRQLREADYVLVIASAAYRLRAEGLVEPEESRGVPFETGLIREAVYKDPVAARQKYLAVLLPGAGVEDIPAFLGPTSTTHYRVSQPTVAGAYALLRLLTDRAGEIEPYQAALPAQRSAVVGSAAAVPVPAPVRLLPADFGMLTDRLLAVPEIAAPARWQQLIDLLPPHVAQAIPRQSSSRTEAIALLGTCRRYPAAWAALVAALRVIDPMSPAVQQFADEVERFADS